MFSIQISYKGNWGSTIRQIKFALSGERKVRFFSNFEVFNGTDATTVITEISCGVWKIISVDIAAISGTIKLVLTIIIVLATTVVIIW